MKLVSRLAIAVPLVALGLVAAPVAPAVAQAVSSAVGKPLQAAQSAARARNIGAATTAINQARAAAKTPAERAKVSQMAAYVFTQGGQYAKAAAELEATGASPRQLAPLYYQARQFGKAASLAQRAGGEDMMILAAQATLQSGNNAGAVKMYQDLIRKNGPKQNYLENLSAAQFKAGDKQGYLATTTRLIKVDPSPARWRALLVDLKNTRMSPEAKLNVYMLMRETGTIQRPEDYQEFAKLSIVNDQSGVVQAALQEGIKAGVVKADDPSFQRIFQLAGQRAGPALAAAPAKARNPATALDAARAYLAAGRYPQAAAAADVAMRAGGTIPDQAKMTKGIAQVRGGAAGAARQTFASVAPTSPFNDIASLWALYASTKA